MNVASWLTNIVHIKNGMTLLAYKVHEQETQCNSYVSHNHPYMPASYIQSRPLFNYPAGVYKGEKVARKEFKSLDSFRREDKIIKKIKGHIYSRYKEQSADGIC